MNKLTIKDLYEKSKPIVFSELKEILQNKYSDYENDIKTIIKYYKSSTHLDTYVSNLKHDFTPLSILLYPNSTIKSLSSSFLITMITLKTKEYCVTKLCNQNYLDKIESNNQALNANFKSTRMKYRFTPIRDYLESPQYSKLEADDVGSFFLPFFKVFGKVNNTDDIHQLSSYLQYVLNFYNKIRLDKLTEESIFYNIMKSFTVYILYDSYHIVFYKQDDFINDILLNDNFLY